MSLFRDGPSRSERDEPVVGYEQWRPALRSRTLATGTLACSECDAPVALAGLTVSPSTPLSCPFCLHRAPVRDFLSLAQPTRPTRVTVRLVARERALPRRIAATRQD